MGALEKCLPREITTQAGAIENTELALPYDQALQAISIATGQSIAILGLEGFEVKKEGLVTVALADASTSIRYAGDWKAYVTRMNAEADRWLREHRLGENHGYILTSTSNQEFDSLPRK